MGGGVRWRLPSLAMRTLLRAACRIPPSPGGSGNGLGSRGSDRCRARLQAIPAAFVAGYRCAVSMPGFRSLEAELGSFEVSLRGFAYEGAAMGLTLLDVLTPWTASRLERFCGSIASPHIYVSHVGAGWVLARVPLNVTRFLRRFDPVLRWLVIDGYGFHEGFFHAARFLRHLAPPSRVGGYGQRAFDQGFGRSLWFLEQGAVVGIADRIASFPTERRGDLWSGVGLAAVYAGEVEDAALRDLYRIAAGWGDHLSQGAAFGAKARERGGALTEYTDQACDILCGLRAAEAAALSDAMLDNLPQDGVEPAYEVWRGRVRHHFRRRRLCEAHCNRL